MPVRAFGASAFGLRGGISMEAAHTACPAYIPLDCLHCTKLDGHIVIN